MIWGGGLLKRIYIPRTAFAVSSIATGLINLFMALFPLLFIMLITGIYPSLAMLMIPIPVLFLACFTLGLGLIMSTIAIFFADVAEMYGILLMAWFYMSPIIWREEMLPQKYLWIMKLNPMYHFIGLFRYPIYSGALPPLQDFLITGAIAFGTLLVGWLIFTWKADEFAYRT
jgi:ABC-type polysaccharide/polyol phosphate export permease